MAARGAKPKAAHLRLVDGTHRKRRHGDAGETCEAVEKAATSFGKAGAAIAPEEPCIGRVEKYIEPADQLDASREPAAIVFYELWQEFRFAPVSLPSRESPAASFAPLVVEAAIEADPSPAMALEIAIGDIVVRTDAAIDEKQLSRVIRAVGSSR